MARTETWERLKYFKPDGSDRFGRPDLISDDLVIRLDAFRQFIGVPVHVLSGVKVEGHAKKSYHYESNGACAVDIVAPEYGLSSVDLLLAAERFNFTGIGFYPHWEYQGFQCGGLHLDTRPVEFNSPQSRWMGVLNEKGQQQYIALTFENIMDYHLEGRRLN